MDEFKMIQESDFGDIGMLFSLFFKDLKKDKNKTEICKITKKEAKQGTNKKIENIEIKIPARTKENDIIKLNEQLSIKIHIYGSKSKRKGRIIYG